MARMIYDRRGAAPNPNYFMRLQKLPVNSQPYGKKVVVVQEVKLAEAFPVFPVGLVGTVLPKKSSDWERLLEDDTDNTIVHFSTRGVRLFKKEWLRLA